MKNSPKKNKEIRAYMARFVEDALGIRPGATLAKNPYVKSLLLSYVEEGLDLNIKGYKKNEQFNTAIRRSDRETKITLLYGALTNTKFIGGDTGAKLIVTENTGFHIVDKQGKDIGSKVTIAKDKGVELNIEVNKLKEQLKTMQGKSNNLGSVSGFLNLGKPNEKQVKLERLLEKKTQQLQDHINSKNVIYVDKDIASQAIEKVGATSRNKQALMDKFISKADGTFKFNLITAESILEEYKVLSEMLNIVKEDEEKADFKKNVTDAIRTHFQNRVETANMLAGIQDRSRTHKAKERVKRGKGKTQIDFKQKPKYYRQKKR